MDYISLISVLTPFCATCFSFVLAYLKHKEAGDKDELARYHKTAYDAVTNAVYNIALAAKDSSVTEDEFQKIIDATTADLQKAQECLN